jgi:hypothetical protein
VVCVNPVLVGVSGCVHSGFGEQAPERRGGRKFHRRVPVEGAAYVRGWCALCAFVLVLLDVQLELLPREPYVEQINYQDLLVDSAY